VQQLTADNAALKAEAAKLRAAGDAAQAHTKDGQE